jgi:hypothetical protein
VNPYGLKLEYEEHADPGSSLLGLLFKSYYYANLSAAIDAIERGLMQGGTWPGWRDVKIIPALMQDEQDFIVQFDTAVYNQLLAAGASPGKAYLNKVEACFAFWKKLEDFLIQHRIQHNYQAAIAKLAAEAAQLQNQLQSAVGAQRK